MMGKTTRRILAFGLFLFATALGAGAAGWFGYSSSLAGLALRGQADLTRASDRLVGQLQRFRQVAVLMADHPELVALTKGQGDVDRVNSLLLSIADKTGSDAIMLASGKGQVLAHSTLRPVFNLTGQPHYDRAMHGALGISHNYNSPTNQRIFSFGAPIIQSGHVLGAVIVSVDIETIEESDWRGDLHAVFFTDDAGLIFVANRSELVMRTRQALKGGAFASVRQRAGYEIWSLNSGPYIPKNALHLTKPLPIIGMRGEVLVSTAPALRLAWLQGAAVAAILLGLGAILFWLTERRRAMAARLRLEAKANEELEIRVEQRSVELKQAQSELLQSAKLAALGQMSAGISHELNQPLMAIRSFAENAETFIERGKPGVALKNLSRISELARRMGRIISNFRAFAKQESEPVGDVDAVAVIEAVIEMNEARFVQEKIRLNWSGANAAILVRAGEVRLQQVLVNLISNAIDAMEDIRYPRIEISVECDAEKARITVRDNGPGIKQPEKIFEPYYTTKAVGKSDGMGLGLSISYGLVQSFGGDIRGRNHKSGGAVFTVELPLAKQKDAA
ncbi:MAG TPA: C4-dicarboxylate ABC transporter [Rhodobacteraceae bacterium]|nr:C4-dicarboxylate ABC transporter [Paracoccaceae bacterium]